MSTVVYVKNAMAPQGREVINAEARTINALAPVDWNRPFVAFLDNEPVLRADWELVLEGEHALVFIDVNAIPQGGGGGGGSKAILAVVFIAALTWFSGGLAAGLYSSMGGTFVAANAGMVIAGMQAGIMMIGSALINMVLGPPKAVSSQQQAALAAPSPTYSIGAQGNSARLESAIPEHFGRHIVFPDFGAMPYQEFAGNEQYLYQLLVIGRGHYDVESVRIEDSLASSFDEIEYQITQPGEAVTKFPVNVVTSLEVAGQTLACVEGKYTQSGVTITFTCGAFGTRRPKDFLQPVPFYPAPHNLTTGMSVYMDFVAGEEGVLTGGIWVEGGYQSTGEHPHDVEWVPGHYTAVHQEPPISAAADGTYTVTVVDANTFTVASLVSQTVSVNLCVVSSWVGPFVSAAAGTITNYLGLDFVCTKGLYYAKDDGGLAQVALHVHAQARLVDDATGLPINGPSGVWQDIVSKVYAGATTTPQANSERVRITQGRYEVRARRVDAEQKSTRYGHSVSWTGLRSYLTDTRTFGDVTVIAMRMKASNNLSSQASRKINVIATRKLPIWNGSTWSPLTATTSIAWALAYACKQVGMTDQQIDLATLLTLDATWTARGDQFNGRFDNFISFWEAITKIAGAGRAKPFMQGGMVRFKRDQAQTIPVAMFSMRNITKGSFSIDYAMPTNETADAVDVKYFDSATWSPAKVQAKLPTSTAAKPAKIDLFGVTSRSQAHREGMYQAASNRYRRRMVKFGAEMDGFIPSYGDLIAIQHDMPAWGQSGEVVEVVAGTPTILKLTESLTWGTGTHNLALRKRDGSISGPYVVTAVPGEPKQVYINATDIVPYTGDSEERTHYAFGWGETYRARAIVVAVRPEGLNKVSIDAVIEDENVHTAENGVIVPPVIVSQLAGYTSKPKITGLTARFAFNVQNKAVIKWNPAPWADHYLIEMSVGNNTWQRVGETGVNHFTATATYGKATQVRVAAVGMARGAWSETTVEVVAPFDVVSASYTIMPTGIKLAWAIWPEIDTYEIRVGGASWDAALVVASVADSEYAWGMQLAGLHTIRIKSKDVNGNYSIGSKDLVVTVYAPSAPDVTYVLAGPDEVLSWTIPTSGFLVDRYEIRYGASWALGTLLTTTKSTTHRRKADFSGDRTYWIAAIDAIGNVGAAGPVAVFIAPPSAVPGMRVDVIDNNALIYWGTPLVGSLPVDRYEARKGATWASGVIIGSNGNSTFTTVFEQQSGIYVYWITAVDSAGNFGTPASVSAMINQPPDYVLRASIQSNFEGGNTNILSSTDKSAAMTVFNGLQAVGPATGVYAGVRGSTGWTGIKDYWETKVLTAGSVVIGVAKSTAPIDGFPGSTTAGFGYFQNGDLCNGGQTPMFATFTVSDVIATAVDLTLGAGNTLTFFKNGVQQGSPIVIGVGPWYPMVGMHSNASVMYNFGSTPYAYQQPTGYDGRINVMDDGVGLLLPINTTESWTQHYVNNAFSTPQSQIAAGFPIYINPSVTVGGYTETIDYGTTLPATNVTALLTTTVVSGTVPMTVQMSYKLNAGDAWIDAPANATSMLATNFRYLKVAYSFTASAGANLIRLNSLTIKLSIKQRGDNGVGVAAVGGTTVNFGYPFMSADTPVVQPNGSVPLIPVVIFAGTVNPTSFVVKLYNLAGADVGGSFSWSVKGY